MVDDPDPPAVSLRDHIAAQLAAMDLRYQQRFDAQTTAINAALLAAKEAVGKAETATERRFESVNEFRQTLTDQAGTFVARVEFEVERKATAERIRELAARVDKTEGRAGGLHSGWGYLIGAVGLIGAVIALVTR
jgi:hypothetical protein